MIKNIKNTETRMIPGKGEENNNDRTCKCLIKNEPAMI